jgi:hypothetical protein
MASKFVMVQLEQRSALKATRLPPCGIISAMRLRGGNRTKPIGAVENDIL